MRNKKHNQNQNQDHDGIDDDMVNALVDKILENPDARDKLLRSVARGVGRRALMAGAGGVLAGMAGMGSVGGSTFVTEDTNTTTDSTSDGSGQVSNTIHAISSDDLNEN